LLRVLLAAVALGFLAWTGRRALIRWIDGPAQQPAVDPWNSMGDLPSQKAEATVPTAASDADAATVAAEVEPPAVRPAWVEPGESGACPDSHPVKVKLRSRLYHLPGMAAYGRTAPDRCYAGAELAEEDGFTRAKR
jgi:hypothetical protein